jgi:hypothetical protein
MTAKRKISKKALPPEVRALIALAASHIDNAFVMANTYAKDPYNGDNFSRVDPVSVLAEFYARVAPASQILHQLSDTLDADKAVQSILNGFGDDLLVREDEVRARDAALNLYFTTRGKVMETEFEARVEEEVQRRMDQAFGRRDKTSKRVLGI